MREFVRKNSSHQLPIDAGAAFRDALGLFEPTSAVAGVQVEVEILDHLPTIRADRLQIEEIILNLLQNALEAVAGQTKRRIRFKAETIEGIVKVSVSDNGPGLSPGAEGRLFEAFFTTKPNGLGLGLSLSRTIVEAHGGRLDVDDSEPGTTTFWFYLPSIEEAARA
jgi:C4-dicarboxylate-specific signal transduction histidine kinase